MLEPFKFHNAISEKPLNAACKLTKSSGIDVAKETTVSPITILDKLNLKEIATEDRTKNSPPTTNNTNPINM